MKTLLAIGLLLSGLLAYAGDSEGTQQEVELEIALAQATSSTKWEDENKYLPQSSRTTSSMDEEQSIGESDQVEYEVIEE